MLWLSLILIITVNTVKGDHWGYPTELANGVVEKGTEGWGGQCSTGRRQSPIDLAHDASIKGRYASFQFQNYDQEIQNASVRNTGHSIQLDVTSGQKYLMSGGGLPGTYIMDQMHFHWGSEHTINNERYGLELHIVSHEEQYANFSMAVQEKNGVAVLGVLFHVADEHNRMLKNILDSADPIKSKVGESSFIKRPFAPLDLLPKNTGDFFRYEGSLTTPDCDEAVMWTILTESIPFAFIQIERFKGVTGEDNKVLTHNYRSLQDLNSRPLIYVHGENLNGGSTIITATLSLILLLQMSRLLFC